MAVEMIYMNPKDFKDIDFTINVPPCSCPWYMHLIPYYKKKYPSMPVCPVTKLEMELDGVALMLEKFPEQLDLQAVMSRQQDIAGELKTAKCNCV